jgi:large subunit ribosomal protein L12
MEYVYAALILNETGEEINEDNVTAVLEAAGADVEQSRVKALVAALEDVDIEEAIDTAAAAPAASGSAAAGAAESGDDEEEEEAEADDEEEADADDEEEEDEEASGEGLGELFG